MPAKLMQPNRAAQARKAGVRSAFTPFGLISLTSAHCKATSPPCTRPRRSSYTVKLASHITLPGLFPHTPAPPARPRPRLKSCLPRALTPTGALHCLHALAAPTHPAHPRPCSRPLSTPTSGVCVLPGWSSARPLRSTGMKPTCQPAAHMRKLSSQSVAMPHMPLSLMPSSTPPTYTQGTTTVNNTESGVIPLLVQAWHGATCHATCHA